MDLIKSTDSKYEEYENLLLERDQITKEAGQIWTVYLQLFGKLITDNYEEKLECIKCKKTIAYYQNALNHGGVVDSAAMEKYMEQATNPLLTGSGEGSVVSASSTPSGAAACMAFS